MPSKTISCPGLEVYATREILRLSSSITRTVRGLDPSSAIDALKEAVTDDIIGNASKLAKAASEGIGSEFTQQLIRGAVVEILDSISSTFPGTRETVDKIKNFTDISFSMIQLVIQLTDKSPLMFASNAKKAYYSAVAARKELISKLSLGIESMIETGRKLQKDGPVAPRISLTISTAITNLTDAALSIDTARAAAFRKKIDMNSVTNARASLKKALNALSPLDAVMGGFAITNNDELSEAILSKIPEDDIINKINAASGINSFDFSDSAVEELLSIGMSQPIKAAFLLLKNVPKVKDPLQILLSKMNLKMIEVTDLIRLIGVESINVSQALINYQAVKKFMEQPLSAETNRSQFFQRILTTLKSRVDKLVVKLATYQEILLVPTRPSDNSIEHIDVGKWMGDIASMMATLNIITRDMYQEKKTNESPVSSVFYTAYERSLKSLKDSHYKWGDLDTTASTIDLISGGISSDIGFVAGINSASRAIKLVLALPGSKSSEDMTRLLTDADTELKSFKISISSLEGYEADINSHLLKFSPEPEFAGRMESLFKMINLAGFDKMFDDLNVGDITSVLSATPEIASYIGLAAACVRNLAANAANEVERAKYYDTSIELSRKERTRFLGKVSISNRSVQAVKNLTKRILDIEHMIRSLLSNPASGVGMNI